MAGHIPFHHLVIFNIVLMLCYRYYILPLSNVDNLLIRASTFNVELIVLRCTHLAISQQEMGSCIGARVGANFETSLQHIQLAM